MLIGCERLSSRHHICEVSWGTILSSPFQQVHETAMWVHAILGFSNSVLLISNYIFQLQDDQVRLLNSTYVPGDCFGIDGQELSPILPRLNGFGCLNHSSHPEYVSIRENIFPCKGGILFGSFPGLTTPAWRAGGNCVQFHLVCQVHLFLNGGLQTVTAWLLQSALHEAVIEKQAEAAAVSDCSDRGSDGHNLVNLVVSLLPGMIQDAGSHL